MAIKHILVPLSGQSDPDDTETEDIPILEAAFQLGQTFAARVQVCLLGPPQEDAGKQLASWLPDYGLKEVFSLLETANEKRKESALRSFETTRTRLQAPAVYEEASGFAVEFLAVDDSAQHSLTALGKLSDLIVIAQPQPEQTTSNAHILEVSLRETGRPVLIAPRASTETIGNNIAVAWNGSSESARAIAMCLPMLQQAERVSCISIRENGDIVPDVEAVAAYLRLHDIDANIVSAEGSPHTAGACLLEEASRVNADLLIMGAYTRSRTRKLIYGGATAHILHKSTIPVLLVD